jgi:hypothetical protein
MLKHASHRPRNYPLHAEYMGQANSTYRFCHEASHMESSYRINITKQLLYNLRYA